jgi:lysozyme family protein
MMKLIPDAILKETYNLVLKAEEFKGLSGTEKREWALSALLDNVDIPLLPKWAEKLIFGWGIDRIVEMLNWLTGYLFGKIKGFLPQDIAGKISADTIIKVIDAPISVLAEVDSALYGDKTPQGTKEGFTAANAVAITPDVVADRLKELCKKYGIEEAEKAGQKSPVIEIPQQETTTAETPAAEPPAIRPETEWWQKAISFTLKYEGGMNFTVAADGSYVMKEASKNDPGGPTNMGILMSTLAAAIGQGVIPNIKLHELTKNQAMLIYKKNYWDRYGWGEVSWPSCAVCFDSCVHHGGFAKIPQLAANDLGYKDQVVKVDGKFGPVTYAAVKKLAAGKPEEFAQALVNRRWWYMRDVISRNPALEYARNGFANRVNALADLCGLKRPA